MRSLRLLHLQKRLDADTERTVFVIPRLVAQDHSWHKGRHVSKTRRDSLRTFVHVERRADAVAGAVTVIQAVGPQVRSRKGVENETFRADRENHLVECDVTLEHARVALLLMSGGRSEVHRSSDIRRATRVLAAAVAE